MSKVNKVKILMVCLGNICRSPLAEGILSSKLDLQKYVVSSAGTANYHEGKSPDPRSVAVAKKYGIDISDQKAAQFTRECFSNFDFIYVMDRENYKNVLKLSTSVEERSKVKLILNEVVPNSDSEVPDPYYGGDQGFEKVFQLLDEACNTIATRI